MTRGPRTEVYFARPSNLTRPAKPIQYQAVEPVPVFGAKIPAQVLVTGRAESNAPRITWEPRELPSRYPDFYTTADTLKATNVKL